VLARPLQMAMGEMRMPPIRRKIRPNPELPEKEAELVEIRQADEHWSTYILADGTALRAKQVATEVWRVVDEWDPEGNPLYLMKSQGIMTVTAPEQLRRKS
jgi:hypothetical protein